MATRRKRRKMVAEINVVPYIDVMLVLLIIFMVTAPLLNVGVDIELPKANAAPLDLAAPAASSKSASEALDRALRGAGPAEIIAAASQSVGR